MKRAFTLVEVIISFGLLSVLFIGVISLYRSGSNSFRAGEWRIAKQKQAQLLLNILREDLEKANHPCQVLANGSSAPTNQTPIAISGYLSTGTASGVATITAPVNMTDRRAVLFSAITEPNIAASAFVPGGRPGRWQGCSLGFIGNVLHYHRTGTTAEHSSFPTAMPGGVMTFPTGGVSAGGAFQPNNTKNIRMSVEDVDLISFAHMLQSSQEVLTIKLRLKRPIYLGWAEATFEETVTARLLDDTSVASFTP